jgi:hypothetical protein
MFFAFFDLASPFLFIFSFKKRKFFCLTFLLVQKALPLPTPLSVFDGLASG